MFGGPTVVSTLPQMPRRQGILTSCVDAATDSTQARFPDPSPDKGGKMSDVRQTGGAALEGS